MADNRHCEDQISALKQEIKLLQEEVRQASRVKRMWQISNEKLKAAREKQLLLQDELVKKINEIEKARLLLEHIASNDKAVIQNMSEGVMITNPKGVIRQVNPAFEKITGYSAEQAIGQTPNILNSGKHERSFFQQMWQQLTSTSGWRGEITNTNASGHLYIQDTSITAVCDWNGKTINYVSVIQDVTAKRQYEKQLRELALYDDLTGLANRRLFKEQVTTSLHMARRRDINFAILFIDLDGFKAVNDNHGHEVGDFVLVEFASRLKQSLREDDEACRFGGDEFAMLLSVIDSEDDANKAASRLMHKLLQPLHWKHQELNVGASIGIAMYPRDGEDYESLIQHADARMYRAKKNRQNT